MSSRDIHEDEFNKKVQELLKASEELNDNWILNEKNGKFYLSKRKIISLRSSLQTPSADDDIDDPSVAMRSAREDLFSIEYHVLFHPSYQVPVLYFNAYTGNSVSKCHCNLIVTYLIPCRRFANIARRCFKDFRRQIRNSKLRA